jgi:hypothetical protein
MQSVADDDADESAGANYQIEMMRCLREVSSPGPCELLAATREQLTGRLQPSLWEGPGGWKDMDYTGILHGHGNSMGGEEHPGGVGHQAGLFSAAPEAALGRRQPAGRAEHVQERSSFGQDATGSCSVH